MICFLAIAARIPLRSSSAIIAVTTIAIAASATFAAFLAEHLRKQCIKFADESAYN